MDRDTLIQKVGEFLDDRDYSEVQDAALYNVPAGFDAEMLLDHFADFALQILAERDEQVKEAIKQANKNISISKGQVEWVKQVRGNTATIGEYSFYSRGWRDALDAVRKELGI